MRCLYSQFFIWATHFSASFLVPKQKNIKILVYSFQYFDNKFKNKDEKKEEGREGVGDGRRGKERDEGEGARGRERKREGNRGDGWSDLYLRNV
jgi:hypothetical protein